MSLMVNYCRYPVWTENCFLDDDSVDEMEPEDFHKALKILVIPSKEDNDTSGLEASFKSKIQQVIQYLLNLKSADKPIFHMLHQISQDYNLSCQFDDTDQPCLGDAMKCNYSNVNEESDNYATDKSSCDIRWEYVKCNLKLLLCLKLSMQSAVKNYESTTAPEKVARHPEHRAPPLSPDTLSFEQQKVIKTSLQFIACLGICPNLIPGIGIPVECRSEFGALLCGVARQTLSVAEREFRMWTCVNVMLDCVQMATLGSLILTRHLSDILAALIQISLAPRKVNKPNMNVDTLNQFTAPENKPVTSELPSSLPNEYITSGDRHLSKEQIRARADVRLKEIITRVYQPALVKDLLMLQAGATSSNKTEQPISHRRPPRWFCQTCSSILTDCLLRPGGVHSVLKAMLEAGNLSSSNFDWRKCDAAARILSTAPTDSSLEKEEFYRNVGNQIVDLLDNDDKLMMALYLRVASKAIYFMLNNEKQLTEKYVINKILGPLFRCTQEPPPISKPIVYVSESELQHTVECTHRVVVLGRDPSSSIIDILDPCINVLLHMYAFCRSGITFLRKLVEDIIVNYMKQCDTQMVVRVLKHFILGSTSSDNTQKTMHRRITFAAGDIGGVKVILTPDEDSTMLLDNRWETLSSTTLELLRIVSSDDLVAEFFLVCLKKLTDIVSSEVSEDSMTNCKTTDETMAELSANLTVLDLLSKMSETLGYTCLLKNTVHVVNFVKLTLERCVHILDNTEEAAMGMFENETVTMAMGLLAAMIQGEMEMTSADYDHCQELLPFLHHIVDAHPDPFMQQLAMDLQISIATRGHLKSHRSKQESASECEEHVAGASSIATAQHNEDSRVMAGSDGDAAEHLEDSATMEVENSQQPQAAEIDVESAGNLESLDAKKSKPGRSDPSNAYQQSLDQVLQDLQDPLIPVKGHALIALKHLLLSRDAEAEKRKDEVLKIFQDHLQHSDTYIYLAAVEGLACLAVVSTDHVLDALVKEYINTCSKVVRSAELRMKIGEVLVKTTRMLGEMAPKYRDVLVTAFLLTARDPDHHIRASSLSNLAEICALLGYSLGNNVHEILNCIGSLTRSDPEVEVKRAAAMFAYKLLQGLGQDTLMILADSIKDLYRLLKMTLTVEKDDVVILHVQLALETLDSIMRKFIFPELKLEKKIHVLSPPSN